MKALLVGERALVIAGNDNKAEWLSLVYVAEVSVCEANVVFAISSGDGKSKQEYGIFQKDAKVVYTFCCQVFSAPKTIEIRNTYGSWSFLAMRCQAGAWERGVWGQKCKLENEGYQEYLENFVNPC